MYPLDLFGIDVLIEDRREGGPFSAERDELRPLEGVGIDQREPDSNVHRAGDPFP